MFCKAEFTFCTKIHINTQIPCDHNVEFSKVKYSFSVYVHTVHIDQLNNIYYIPTYTQLISVNLHYFIIPLYYLYILMYIYTTYFCVCGI
jgi:hypothetical protein